jgi:hypothetical protein
MRDFSLSLSRRALLSAGVVTLALGLAAPAAGPEEPRFDSEKQLVRPEGYREWVFVGSSLGMSYSEDAPSREARFHNVYVKPAAYRHFQETGKFLDGTILVMEVLTAASHESINRHGQFQGRFVGIEAAVKDSSRFAEKWAYFSFIAKDGSPKPLAKAFPQDACWSCHNDHGATDNVFTQFYPMLRQGE